MTNNQLKLGNFQVNRLGYGAMRITGDGIWGEPKNHQESIAVLKKAVELGVNFIDTADAYGPNVSENLIYEALHPYSDLVIATKGGLTRQGPGQWTPDGRPEHLKEALEGSLERLHVDSIDLYQLHSPDSKVPFEESLQTLIDLKSEGKIKNIGLSNVSLEQLQKARQMTEIVSVQNRYNIINQSQNQNILDYCTANQIIFIPYFPIGGDGSNLSRLEDIAKKHHASVHQIALAWLLNQSPIILPIPGTNSIQHLEENMAALQINLDQEDLESLKQ